MASLSKGPWDGEGRARMGLGEAKASSNMSLECWVKHPVPKPWALTLPGTARLAGVGDSKSCLFLCTPGSVLLLMVSLIYPL